MVSKHHRGVVLKRLKEAIENEKDPDRLTKLTAQYVKLNAQKRPRKSADVPSAESTGGDSAIVAKWEKRLSHLPIEKRIQFSVILEVEERLKKQGMYKWPQTDESRALVRTLCSDVEGMLSEQERLVLAVAQAVEAESSEVAKHE